MLKINKKLLLYFICLVLSLKLSCCYDEEVCLMDGSETCNEETQLRYLFYDVNPPEGFNLRRDVYMRFAVLAHQLKQSKNPALNKFNLVLPPWSHLVHWGYSEHPEHIPWGLYFDLKSLRKFAPVIEMHEFFSSYRETYQSKIKIEKVYTLQHFEDMFETGNFEDRMQISKCDKLYPLNFFYYDNLTARSADCLSYHGPATKLTEVLLNSTASTILINHAEVALHDFFGNKLYWQARRSMRFNKELVEIAADFRKDFLESTDEKDKTVLPDNWQDEKLRRDAIGGPYLAVHLRRRDFVRSRPKDVPSLESVAEQIITALKKVDLNIVFVASDGPDEEFKKLAKMLSGYEIYNFVYSRKVKDRFGEGGIAIVDQIICSHARYFIGTHESTFSYRIQEEREILGFSIDTTFNVFCRDEKSCKEASKWTIVY